MECKMNITLIMMRNPAGNGVLQQMNYMQSDMKYSESRYGTYVKN